MVSKRRISTAMSTAKLEISKKRSMSKTKNSIKILFEKLRNESTDSLGSSNNNTVICLDNSSQSPVNGKRKILSSESHNRIKLRKIGNSNNSIIIKDEDTLETNTQPCNMGKTPRKGFNINPVGSSTPIHNNKNEIIELDISRVSNVKENNNCVVKNLNEDIEDLTREINPDSLVTIDLTTDSIFNRTDSNPNTVIDLCNTSDVSPDCILTSVSNTNLSLSGESDVTVLNECQEKKNKKHINRFVNGISKLNASDKGKILELITKNIFNGCNVPKKLKSQLKMNKETDTLEDTFIKEVILGQSTSRNSIGSNIYNPEKDFKKRSGLRMIVIDGSNVAMEHSKGRVFSVKGLKICIDYFLKRGHVVKAFVPRFRCKFGKSTEPRLLDELERRGLVVYTPSREIQSRLVTSYDDRYIVQCAAEFDGVIVSGDNYRDLLQENNRWRFIIENRLLQFTWVNDMIMFPKDPLGRHGPSLETFLRHT